MSKPTLQLEFYKLLMSQKKFLTVTEFTKLYNEKMNEHATRRAVQNFFHSIENELTKKIVIVGVKRIPATAYKYKRA